MTGGRLIVAAALSVVLAVGAVGAGVVPPPGAADPPAVAGATGGPGLGERCSARDDGVVRLDRSNGITLRCVRADGGRTWQTADGVDAADALARRADRRSAAPGAPAPTTMAFRRSTGAAAPRVGDRCRRQAGRTSLSPDTGEHLRCTDGRWVAVPPGTQRPAPTTTLPPLPAPPPPAGPPPLPADACTDRGLPEGVSLPPGAVARAGMPEFAPTIDRSKQRRCITVADLPVGTELETVHRFFVDTCAAIGWRHDPRGVERLPTDPLPGPSYDRSTQMVLGECRTRAGDPVDRRRRTPWFLAWSVEQPAGAAPALIVEVRDTSRVGGRPGGS